MLINFTTFRKTITTIIILLNNLCKLMNKYLYFFIKPNFFLILILNLAIRIVYNQKHFLMIFDIFLRLKIKKIIKKTKKFLIKIVNLLLYRYSFFKITFKK